MSESKELAVVRDQQLSLSTWQVIQAIAPTMHQSRLFGVSSPDQAAAIMIKGAELGLSLSASFEFVQVVEGKPTLSPRGALALVMNSGDLAGFKLELDELHCKVWMKRRSNGFEHTETFTMDDARRAELVKPKSGWEKYPKNMLKWRAIGFCIDSLFSDICGGMKRADEFGATVDAAGDVVEGDWTPVPQAGTGPAPEPPTEPPSNTSVNLDDLVIRFGAEAVMVAAGGRIPATMDEVATVAARLASNG